MSSERAGNKRSTAADHVVFGACGSAGLGAIWWRVDGTSCRQVTLPRAGTAHFRLAFRGAVQAALEGDTTAHLIPFIDRPEADATRKLGGATFTLVDDGSGLFPVALRGDRLNPARLCPGWVAMNGGAGFLASSAEEAVERLAEALEIYFAAGGLQ